MLEYISSLAVEAFQLGVDKEPDWYIKVYKKGSSLLKEQKKLHSGYFVMQNKRGHIIYVNPILFHRSFKERKELSDKHGFTKQENT